MCFFVKFETITIINYTCCLLLFDILLRKEAAILAIWEINLSLFDLCNLCQWFKFVFVGQILSCFSWRGIHSSGMSAVRLPIIDIRIHLNYSKHEHFTKYKTFIDAFVYDLQRFPLDGLGTLVHSPTFFHQSCTTVLVRLSGCQGNVLHTRLLWSWVANGNI